MYNEIDCIIEKTVDEIIKIRRALHKIPEVGMQERETTNYIEKCLTKHNLIFERNKGYPGGTCLIVGNSNTKTVGIRADIDGLNIQEENYVDYKSINDGCMHACGHDVHSAIMIGTGIVLNSVKNQLNGNVKMIFQPAEETTGGALPMIEDGCLENPHVDYIIGNHVEPYLEVGQIESRYGCLNAASDDIEIIVSGKTTHAAYPEEGVDVILVLSHVLSALQSVISRNISAYENAVLSFGKIQGGSAHNGLGGVAKINGTLRTTSPVIRTIVKERIESMSYHICKAFQAECNLKIIPGYTHLINDSEVIDKVKKVSQELDYKYIEKKIPSLGVDDFSYFLGNIPGAYYHIGCGNKEKGYINPLHSSRFMVDEECIKVGVEMQVYMVLELLN